MHTEKVGDHHLWPAGAAFALEPPGKSDNADLGPNEVSKEKIGEVSEYADNKFDTAAPGTGPVGNTEPPESAALQCVIVMDPAMHAAGSLR